MGRTDLLAPPTQRKRSAISECIEKIRRSDPSLTELDLTRQPILAAEIQALSDALPFTTTLTCLTLSSLNLLPENVVPIIDGLKRNTSLMKLSFKDNSLLGDGSVIDIINAILTHRKLETLNLYGTGIKRETLQNIVNILRSHVDSKKPLALKTILVDGFDCDTLGLINVFDNTGNLRLGIVDNDIDIISVRINEMPVPVVIATPAVPAIHEELPTLALVEPISAPVPLPEGEPDFPSYAQLQKLDESNRTLLGNMDLNLRAEIPNPQEIYEFPINRNSNLGKGSYGEVFAIRHMNTGLWIAVKEMQKNSVTQTSFEREIRALVPLRPSNNIIKMYGYFSYENSYYLALELALCSLEPVLYLSSDLRHPLPVSIRLRFAREFIAGLVAMHENNFLHCDLKPDNCLIGPDLNLRITDFGSTKLLRKTPGVSKGIAPSLLWAAPEIFDEDESRASAAADMYTYGLIVWSFAASKITYTSADLGDDVRDTLERLRDQYEAQRLINELDSDALPIFKTLIERCAVYEPTGRWTAKQAQQALSDVKEYPVTEQDLVTLYERVKGTVKKSSFPFYQLPRASFPISRSTTVVPPDQTPSNPSPAAAASPS